MITCKRHRFLPSIISYAVWLYHRFNLSHRDIEDLLAERGIAVSYEAIRLWCAKFGPEFTKRLRRNHQGYGDTFYIDEVFVKIQGKQHYSIRQQSSGALTSTDASQRARHEAIQIRMSGAELSQFARRYIQFVQPGSSFDIGE